MGLTVDSIDSSSDEELSSLLTQELSRAVSAEKRSPEFIAEIRKLPVGLRAMAATYELDVSLAMDDLGWHSGNWHSAELAEETARGLEELGATELATLFREAFRIAEKYWTELGEKDWMDWYHKSDFEKETLPLTKRAWEINKGKMGIFQYWVDYARKYPER